MHDAPHLAGQEVEGWSCSLTLQRSRSHPNLTRRSLVKILVRGNFSDLNCVGAAQQSNRV